MWDACSPCRSAARAVASLISIKIYAANRYRLASRSSRSQTVWIFPESPAWRRADQIVRYSVRFASILLKELKKWLPMSALVIASHSCLLRRSVNARRDSEAARRRPLNSNLRIMDDKLSTPLLAINGLQEPGYSYARAPPQFDFPAEPFVIRAVHETPLLLDRRRSFRRP
jgi:hypothetical protein